MAEVRAEMVANVWKVVATEGDQVEDGDTLVGHGDGREYVGSCSSDVSACIPLSFAGADAAA